MGAVGKRHYRYRPDGLAHESSQTSHQVVTFTRDIDARIEAPHSVTSEGALFHVKESIYPNGIELVSVQILLATPATYSIVYEEWSGSPVTHDNDIATVTTTDSEDYNEVLAIAMDDSTVAANAWIYLHISSTVIDWSHVKVVFNVL